MVIAACHSWPLRHSHARADVWVTRWLQVLSAHWTGDVPWDAYGARTAPLAPVRRPYCHRSVSVRVPCACSRNVRCLEICDHVGYGHSGIVRCLKSKNRTISPLTKLSYGARGRSICDWGLRWLNRRSRKQRHAIAQGLYFSDANSRWWATPHSPEIFAQSDPPPFKRNDFDHGYTMLVLLRPSNLHRHHGWLPPNQHRHMVFCSVLGGLSGCCILKTAPHFRTAAIVDMSKCRVRAWTHGESETPLAFPRASASPLANDSTPGTAGTVYIPTYGTNRPIPIIGVSVRVSTCN